MSTHFMNIDDTSSDVHYTGDWITGGNTSEYDHSTHAATEVGDSAVLTFKGLSIEVFGTIGMENGGDPSFAPTSQYILDGGQVSKQDFTYHFEHAEVVYNVSFFKSPQLPSPEGQHTLSVIYMVANCSPLWLDYFRIELAEPLPTSSQTDSVPVAPFPSSSTSGSTQATRTLQNTAPPSFSSFTQNPSESSPLMPTISPSIIITTQVASSEAPRTINTNASSTSSLTVFTSKALNARPLDTSVIAGIAIGCVVAISIVIVAAYALRRCQSRFRKTVGGDQTSSLTPFTSLRSAESGTARDKGGRDRTTPSPQVVTSPNDSELPRYSLIEDVNFSSTSA